MCFSRLSSVASVAALATGMVLSLPASAALFATGDVFASVGSGLVNVYKPDGTLITVLNTGLGGFTTGSTTDKAGNFYVTNFSAGSVSKFDNNGNLLGTAAAGYTTPESILFAKNGTGYVGDAGQNHIHTIGGPDITVATQDRGTDWIDLNANQTTFDYTSEGNSILRFDTVGGQLSNFANGLPGTTAYALRILSNGEVLVADSQSTILLDAAGNILKQYTFAGDGGLFSLDLNRDQKSFWTGSFQTGNLYEVDLATGALLKAISTGSAGQLFGVSVYGEFQAGGGGVTGGVPELSTWAMMIIGFGGVGLQLRRRYAVARAA
jgi:hypothetical protein